MMTNAKIPRITHRLPISKPHGGIHPSILEDYYPQHKFWPEEPGDATSYGHLTDDTPYCEYAWEFLRRNRFFQLDHDRRADKTNGKAFISYDEEAWAPESIEGIPPSCGLARHHHYSWEFTQLLKRKDGTTREQTVEWEWIKSFGDQFLRLKQPTTRPAAAVLDTTQVSIVFDLAPITHNELALKRQLERVEKELLDLSKARSLVVERQRDPKAKNKGLLRNYLRIIDLFSRESNRATMDVVTNTYFSMYDTDSAKSKTQQRSMISALAKEAFKYVYKGEYLSLLAFDPWFRLEPSAPKAKPITEKKQSSLSQKRHTPKKTLGRPKP